MLSATGVVLSDTDGAITNGLDLEFGSWTNGLSNGASNAYDNYYLAKAYLDKIKSGKYTTKELDEKFVASFVFHSVRQ